MGFPAAGHAAMPTVAAMPSVSTVTPRVTYAQAAVAGGYSPMAMGHPVGSYTPMPGAGSYSPMPGAGTYAPGSYSYTPPPGMMAEMYAAMPTAVAAPSYTPPVVNMTSMQALPSNPYVTPTPSYVPPPYAGFSPMAMAPGMMAVPSYVPPQQSASYVPAPTQPMQSTANIPDPDSIDRQRAAYHKSIDAQLNQQIQAIQQQAQREKQMLTKGSELEKAQAYVSVDQYAQQYGRALDEQTLSEMMRFQEESAQHRAILEQQAASLALEYNQKKAQEDMAFRQYEVQRQYYTQYAKLQQMQTQLQQGVIPQGLINPAGAATPGAGGGAQPSTASMMSQRPQTRPPQTSSLQGAQSMTQQGSPQHSLQSMQSMNGRASPMTRGAQSMNYGPSAQSMNYRSHHHHHH